jgi:hypothetical protein
MVRFAVAESAPAVLKKSLIFPCGGHDFSSTADASVRFWRLADMPFANPNV